MEIKRKIALSLALMLAAGCALFSPIKASAAAQDEKLAKNTSWGSYQTDVTGGIGATASNIYTVTNRAQFVSALGGQTNTTSRIIMVSGTIDLCVDGNNKSLGENDFITSGYSLSAYMKAYDPATWGTSKVPSGTQEDARAASAANQKAVVQIKVGSNISIIGIGSNAKIINGGLHLPSDVSVL